MSIEHYAVFRAAPGSLCDRKATEVMEQRQAAQNARSEYSKSIGGVGLWCNDSRVDGVIFPTGATLPAGWRKGQAVVDGFVALPDKKKKQGQNNALQLRQLPSLPGFERFTAAIGSSGKIIRRYLRWCYFERVGETLLVMTPFFPKEDGHGDPDENAPADQIFTPEGCERVPLSVYYATKEAAEAAKNATKGVVAA